MKSLFSEFNQNAPNCLLIKRGHYYFLIHNSYFVCLFSNVLFQYGCLHIDVIDWLDLVFTWVESMDPLGHMLNIM